MSMPWWATLSISQRVSWARVNGVRFYVRVRLIEAALALVRSPLRLLNLYAFPSFFFSSLRLPLLCVTLLCSHASFFLADHGEG